MIKKKTKKKFDKFLYFLMICWKISNLEIKQNPFRGQNRTPCLFNGSHAPQPLPLYHYSGWQPFSMAGLSIKTSPPAHHPPCPALKLFKWSDGVVHYFSSSSVFFVIVHTRWGWNAVANTHTYTFKYCIYGNVPDSGYRYRYTRASARVHIGSRSRSRSRSRGSGRSLVLQFEHNKLIYHQKRISAS